MVQRIDVNSAIGSPSPFTLGAKFVLILTYLLAPRITCRVKEIRA